MLQTISVEGIDSNNLKVTNITYINPMGEGSHSQPFVNPIFRKSSYS